MYVYMYNWIPLLCTWNIVSQLYFSKIYWRRKKSKIVAASKLEKKKKKGVGRIMKGMFEERKKTAWLRLRHSVGEKSETKLER